MANGERSNVGAQAVSAVRPGYDAVMRSPVRRRTSLPPDLEAAAVRHLRRANRTSRMAAAQLLARGWSIDEDARLTAIPEHDRPDGYDESTDPAHPPITPAR